MKLAHRLVADPVLMLNHLRFRASTHVWVARVPAERVAELQAACDARQRDYFIVKLPGRRGSLLLTHGNPTSLDVVMQRVPMPDLAGHLLAALSDGQSVASPTWCRRVMEG